MENVKERNCLYCGNRLDERRNLFCSAECKSKYEEQERGNYIRGIDKNWK